jgi:hypothetical protein
MKAEDIIREQMQPGVISRDGFLGRDTRALNEIIADDQAAVRRLNLTHERIAARLRALRAAGAGGLGAFIPVAPHFEVAVEAAPGLLPCPFLDQVLIPKTSTTVRNLSSGAEVSFTDLNIHLIEAHGFYEGRQAPFRLEPEQLAAVLDI